MPEAKLAASVVRAPAYSRYAEVYDAIGQREFGERIAEATLRHLDELGFRPRRCVDLACGTGAATLVFAAAGMQAIGIDSSPSMIAKARTAAEQSGLRVEWRAGDMRAFCVEEPADLVTCFYDGINYLLELSDVADAFRAAAATLRDGGLYIFDVNTRTKFAADWSDAHLVAVDRDNVFGVYQSWFEPETGISPLVMTFFVKTPKGCWERFDEEHVERAYPLAELTRLLGEAGFEAVGTFDYRDRSPRFGGPGSESSLRVVFVARHGCNGEEST